LSYCDGEYLLLPERFCPSTEDDGEPNYLTDSGR
jgi:hypothetical protein